MRRFHELTVTDLRRETADSVSFALAVPEEARDAFRFLPGQYLALRAAIGGREVRRSYSICSGAGDGEMRVAVKRVEGGAFSVFANEALRDGDRLGAMPPDGRFAVRLDPARARRIAAFAAGSGVTPVLSILKSVLEGEPESRCALFYGNRDRDSIMFRRALDDLKDRFPDRFALAHILSREPRETGLLAGRIDAEKCARILPALVDPAATDDFYLCGPEGMTAAVRAALAARGVARDRIHVEYFEPSSEAAALALARRAARAREAGGPAAGGASQVTATLDGASVTVPVARDGESILDALLRVRADMPHACKGGMCCTCRARVVEGEAEMDVNYTLDPEETARGFVLTCQAHPLTDRVVLDYDAR